MRELPMLVKEWRARVVENKLGHFNKKLDPVQVRCLPLPLRVELDPPPQPCCLSPSWTV